MISGLEAAELAALIVDLIVGLALLITHAIAGTPLAGILAAAAGVASIVIFTIGTIVCGFIRLKARGYFRKLERAQIERESKRAQG
jgi:hypothetical protein